MMSLTVAETKGRAGTGHDVTNCSRDERKTGPKLLLGMQHPAATGDRTFQSTLRPVALPMKRESVTAQHILVQSVDCKDSVSER